MNPTAILTAALLCALSPISFAKPLKVFILAEQSNMQGHANTLTFDYIGKDPLTAPILAAMRDTEGKPRVWVNILEFALRTAPMTPSTTALPAIQQYGGQWVFEYDRNDDSLPPGTTQVVQYGSDLSSWTDITIPATSSGAVTITPGMPTDRVRVVIPNHGTKVFARLKVAVTP